MLQIKNISKAYKRYHRKCGRLAEWLGLGTYHEKRWVLQNISFNVERGQAVGIVGVNGAGKSTLLKIITGTTRPTTGSVHVEGRISALLELGMGFHPDFTGRQNCYMSGQLHGNKAREIEALIPEIADFAQIGDYFDQPVRTYSSGMQVRLAFALATAAKPEILLVDEALSVGDAYFQAKCYDRMSKYKEQGMTLVLVTHAVGDIVKHCDRAIMLRGGEIFYEGSPRKVTNLYMDEIFGKKPGQAQQSFSPQKSRGSFLDSNVQDTYHTRPYYRKDEHRWGHGGAKILDYSVLSDGEEFPSRIESNSITEFYVKIFFENDYNSVVPGFLLKTLSGIFLYGTNSFLSSKHKSQLSVSKDEMLVCKFSLPMALNEGNYLISLGVSEGNPLQNMTPLDRRYDSILIDVSRPVQFWGIADLQASFEIEERKIK